MDLTLLSFSILKFLSSSSLSLSVVSITITKNSLNASLHVDELGKASAGQSRCFADGNYNQGAELGWVLVPCGVLANHHCTQALPAPNPRTYNRSNTQPTCTL